MIEAGQKGKEGANQATPQVADRRKNHIHQTTAHRVGKYRPDATEDLSIKNMTASAKGTAENPGNNVTEKAGLPHDPGHRAGGASHYPCTKAEGWVSGHPALPAQESFVSHVPFLRKDPQKTNVGTRASWRLQLLGHARPSCSPVDPGRWIARPETPSRAVQVAAMGSFERSAWVGSSGQSYCIRAMPRWMMSSHGTRTGVPRRMRYEDWVRSKSGAGKAP